MAAGRATNATETLLANRSTFKAFLASRLGNDADAEDLLQNSLLKALQRSHELKDSEKLLPWFYQILRNAMIDHARSRQATAKREQAWVADAQTLADHVEMERQICVCFEKLLPLLKPEQAELLRRVELESEPVKQASDALGISANSASVSLHRARRALRAKLVELCGDCSCLDDCTCG